jgi:hypothetical protein
VKPIRQTTRPDGGFLAELIDGTAERHALRPGMLKRLAAKAAAACVRILGGATGRPGDRRTERVRARPGADLRRRRWRSDGATPAARSGDGPRDRGRDGRARHRPRALRVAPRARACVCRHGPARLPLGHQLALLLLRRRAPPDTPVAVVPLLQGDDLRGARGPARTGVDDARGPRSRAGGVGSGGSLAAARPSGATRSPRRGEAGVSVLPGARRSRPDGQRDALPPVRERWPPRPERAMAGDWYDVPPVERATPAVAPPLPPPRGGDQLILLRGISWEQYDALDRARGRSAMPRFAYLDGELEIVTHGRDHEVGKSSSRGSSRPTRSRAGFRPTDSGTRRSA